MPNNKTGENFASSWLIYLNCMMMHVLTNFKCICIWLVLDTICTD